MSYDRSTVNKIVWNTNMTDGVYKINDRRHIHIVLDQSPCLPIFAGGSPIFGVHRGDAELKFTPSGGHCGATARAIDKIIDEELDVFCEILNADNGNSESQRIIAFREHIEKQGGVCIDERIEGTDYVTFFTPRLWKAMEMSGPMPDPFMDEYRAYLEGEVYGREVIECDAETGDENVIEEMCWGYYGDEGLSDEIEHLVKEYDK